MKKNLSRLFERIADAYLRQLPFVVYRLPESNEIRSFIQKDSKVVHPENEQNSGFIMAPFDGRKKSVLLPSSGCEILSVEVPDNWIEESEGNSVENSVEEESARRSHIDLVERAINKIRSGEADKIVVSRKEETQIEIKEPLVLFQRLAQRIPGAFCYLWNHPGVGMWAGASPERLVSERSGLFTTMALAGTQSYSGNTEVFWGDKDREEQQMVTDQICKKFDMDTLELSEPYSKRARNLWHICTDIKGHLPKGMNVEDLIGKLHPTAAVCGLPTAVARRFILENEGYDRKFYSGFLGEINLADAAFGDHSTEPSNESSSEIYVNLRCMELDQQEGRFKVSLFIGGGITSKSIPEKEWVETIQKSRVIKSVL